MSTPDVVPKASERADPTQRQPPNLTPQEEARLRHWTEYGQRGKMPTSRVMPWDWQTANFIAPKTVPWTVQLDPGDLPILLLGFCPTIGTESFGSNRIVTEAEAFGETITSQIFMSTSKNPKMKASEDKWFVYAEGPDAEGNASLHMYRSWTGFKMITLDVQAGSSIDAEGDMRPPSIVRITWETSPDVRQWRDEQEPKHTALEVCDWVLNVKIDRSRA